MTRETRAIANAKRILNTLERFPTADVHTRNNHIGKIKGRLTLIERDGPTQRYLDSLERVTNDAEKWLIERTKERMKAGT